MTNKEAIKNIREHCYFSNLVPTAREALEIAIKALEQEEAREHMDMLIAHKDKALETHSYFKRCDSCIHSEEQDGCSCYECIKNMADNFEAQPTDEIKEAYLKGYEYGVKDWFKSKTQPTEAVSREAVEEITFQEPSYTDPYNILTEVREKVRALPTVYPERPKGKWIHWTDDYKDYCTCSECGYGEEGEVLFKDKTPYCPYCGSYNGGNDNGDE